MATLNMQGPYALTAQLIDVNIPLNQIGNYALGYIDDNSSFIVKYVGRSDSDLNTRLKQHIGNYKHFKYSFASSSNEAYAKELRNYHDFGGSENLDNEIEPAKPAIL